MKFGEQNCVCLQVVIPFFSVFLKDLYYLNETYSSHLSNGDINFEVKYIIKVYKHHYIFANVYEYFFACHR